MLTLRNVSLLILLAAALVLVSPAVADSGNGAHDVHLARRRPGRRRGRRVRRPPDLAAARGPTVIAELVSQDAVQAQLRWYFLQWDSFGGSETNSWYHYYRPIVCFNGSVITGRDQSSHWQETQGHYHPSGVSHHVVAGCTGCTRIQLKGIASFRWAWGGAETQLHRCANLSVRETAPGRAGTGC